MKRLTLSFIILAGLLFVGIAILMKPATFVPMSLQNQSSSYDQLSADRTIPTEIIVLGSALTILGVVGLSVQGFRMFKEFDREETRSN